MKINSVRVYNYKSFLDSGEIEFSEGFNIIVGQNNAGKTALLETLGFNIQNIPHRSTVSIPNPNIPPVTKSSLRASLRITGTELRDVVEGQHRGAQFYIALPTNNARFTGLDVYEQLVSKEFIDLEFDVSDARIVPVDILRHHGYEAVPGSIGIQGARIQVNPHDGSISLADTNKYSISDSDDITSAILPSLFNRVYIFKAERLNVSDSPFGSQTVLANNASNLPEVLSNLSGNNPVRYLKLVNYVKLIFPSITDVRVRASKLQGGMLEIVTWIEDPELEREDLSIPLSASGTGVGQVLAILYVVLTSYISKVIVIDEPTNFLHPGAARKLLEIIKLYPQHQYIITTHSADIIKIVEPSMLHLVKWERPQSQIETLKNRDVSGLRRSMLEVGARFSDVFGADSVIWVEGATEEEAFKIILGASDNALLEGTTIAAVAHTDDFGNKKNAGLVSLIYRKLTTSNALLPIPIGFIFDREEKTKQQMRELSNASDGRIHFIGKRQFENYLLDLDAILELMMSLQGFIDLDVTKDFLNGWVESNGARYIKNFNQKPSLSNDEYKDRVDAAKLLSSMFSQISEGREEYRKTTHSLSLTDWLVKHKPHVFSEIVELIKRIINQKPAI
ncbi:AAA family ATPase [Deinococcus planocerae]|uniref:AAA family ATPase n=1 Tax=Deinococcus planocerae TaxID=1737569 RepID=UPI0011AF8CBC|nr:AAA family ATPase [Deinococcus planocerae]